MHAPQCWSATEKRPKGSRCAELLYGLCDCNAGTPRRPPRQSVRNDQNKCWVCPFRMMEPSRQPCVTHIHSDFLTGEGGRILDWGNDQTCVAWRRQCGRKVSGRSGRGDSARSTRLLVGRPPRQGLAVKDPAEAGPRTCCHYFASSTGNSTNTSQPIIALAAQHKLPAIYFERFFAILAPHPLH